MRTTLSVGDKPLRSSKSTPQRDAKRKNGWVQIELPPGSPELTSELIDKWESETYDDEYRRATCLRGQVGLKPSAS
jgi:hypothetical protein